MVCEALNRGKLSSSFLPPGGVKSVGEKDVQLYLITDSVEKVLELLREKCIKAFRLQPR